MQIRLGIGAKTDMDYRTIIGAVSSGAVSIKEIAEKTGMDRTVCRNRISALISMEILEEVRPMFGAPKHPMFRVKDDAVAFYYEVIEKNRMKIDRERPDATLSRLASAISTFHGMRFERACEAYLKRSYPCIEVGRW